MLNQPSELAKAIVADFQTLRGGYLSAFSQIEFAISRTVALLNRCERFDFRLEKLPQKAQKRADVFVQIFKTETRLHHHMDQATGISRSFKEGVELRNFFAHGFARVDMERKLVQLRMFKERDGNSWNEDEYHLSFDDFTPTMARMDYLTQRTLTFVLNLSEEFELGF